MSKVVTVVLGGGRGTRLYPLTAGRAKPAVPLAGKYRLIDVPISNAINSGLRDLFVLTQFNSASLNAHIAKTYRFDPFSAGFVEVLAAEQTETSGDWYQGTADAIRQTLHHIDRGGAEHLLILSGDHLYRMDYRPLIERHLETRADATLSAIPVTREGCAGLGIMSVDREGMVTGFAEKPTPDDDISALQAPEDLCRLWGMGERSFLASMGVYVFRISALREMLESPTAVDFGKDVLPAALDTHRLSAYLFDGYWEDIGTISAFYQANLALCEREPPFRFYDPDSPIFSRPRFLPPSLFWDSSLERAVVTEGCTITGARIVNSIVGLRAHVEPGTVIEDSILMGNEAYQYLEERRQVRGQGGVPQGIGEGCRIRRAIIDKNARIGDGCVIEGKEGRPDEDHRDWMVREGIVCVAKNAVIPAGSVL